MKRLGFFTHEEIIPEKCNHKKEEKNTCFENIKQYSCKPCGYYYFKQDPNSSVYDATISGRKITCQKLKKEFRTTLITADYRSNCLISKINDEWVILMPFRDNLKEVI